MLTVLVPALILSLAAPQGEPPASPPPATEPATPPATEPATPPATEPATPPATEPATPPATEPATPPASEPATPPTTEPATPPATEPATLPATEPATPPATPPVTTDEPKPTAASGEAGAWTEASLPAETRRRVHIVVDRISTAHGEIETEDDEVIVIREARGRIRSFAKNRVINITYLLEGPEGRRVRVAFNDGRTLVAPLVEDGYEAVVLDIEGIRTRYDRAAVAEVRPYPTDEELYRRFRESLEPDQYGARYSLALWLARKRMYAESKEELENLLDETNHYEAGQLLIEVDAQLKLLEPRGPRDPSKPRPRDGGADGRAGAPSLDDQLPTTLLTDADVNLIRVYELDLADPPRLQVPEPTIRTLLEKYADSALIPAKAAEKQAFFSKDPVDIVKTMFALKARELYPEIRVLGEPESLNLFRTRVHNAWLIGNCATSRCHGGADAGRLFLHNRNFKDENVRYTNLLILLRSRIDGRPLVDFDKPTDSLIYQYALPRTEARWQHPEARGWSPALTSSRRGLQEDFVNWVRSMRAPKTDYPVEFTPPAMSAPDVPDRTGPDR